LVTLLSYFTVNVLVFETRWAGYKLAITMHFLQVIITEASKNVQDFGKGWNPTLTIEEEGLSRVGSLNEGPAVFKSPSKSWKVISTSNFFYVFFRSCFQFFIYECQHILFLPLKYPYSNDFNLTVVTQLRFLCLVLAELFNL